MHSRRLSAVAPSKVIISYSKYQTTRNPAFGAYQPMSTITYSKKTYSEFTRLFTKPGIFMAKYLAISKMSMVKNTTIFALNLLFVWKSHKNHPLTCADRKYIIYLIKLTDRDARYV